MINEFEACALPAGNGQQSQALLSLALSQLKELCAICSGPKSDKEANPYALPSNARLLSYWQHRNSALKAADTWRIGHTWQDHDPRVEQARVAAQRTRDISSGLANQLRRSSAQSSFSKSRYVHDIRLLSTCRLVLGQKRDACIQLDQQLDIERQRYLKLKRECKECVLALEEFLSRDHEDSMRVLNLAETESSLTSKLSDRRDELSRRYGQARLQVYHWEEAWRTVRACHRFLHRVSPLGILAEEDDDNELEAESNEATLENGSSAANRLTASVNQLANATSLDSLIAAFEKEAIGLSKSAASEPSELGLVEANDLLKLFRDMELQNLNGLIHLESLGGPMSDMIARISVAEVQVNREIDDVLDGIKQLERAIELEERRAQRLESKAGRLVQRHFRALVCSEQALRARVLVEEAYESCVEANEAGLEPLAMARGLESAYEQLSVDLDGLPRDLVLICERDGFRQEMRETREAEEAAKKFELMHRLLAALRRIMEQTKEPKRRMLMRRSLPKIKRKLEKTNDLDSSAKQHDPRDLTAAGVCAKREDNTPDNSSDDD